MKSLIYLLRFPLWLVFLTASHAVAENPKPPLDIYLFWSESCPHCTEALGFAKKLQDREPKLRIHFLEVTRVPSNRNIFMKVTRHFGIEHPSVPLTVVGDRYFSGFDDDTTTGREISNAVKICIKTSCINIIQPLLSGEELPPLSNNSAKHGVMPKILKLPVFGEISPAYVSLPVLTVMLAVVDGFNPCAMWTLIFLISLLIGLRDRFRMWALGMLFIAASAGVYFMFMAAWLNLLLFFGMLLWIRLAVGLLALSGGSYYLYEFFFNPEAVCKVTAPAARQRIFAKLRELAGERSFLLAMIGIVLLAFAVNLVELICSAGIPAVYTQVLVLSELPAWQYYAYLSLYILIFMLDDLAVFFIAMKTLQITGITGAYVRHSHAIGGMVLIAIGLMLLFKPEWLTFSL